MKPVFAFWKYVFMITVVPSMYEQTFSPTGGEIWSEKMVSYCSDVKREDWQTV